MSKVLMKGNEAIAEAAVRAGCLNYFAYPITPQSEIGEYLAHRLPEAGGMFLQAESEIAVVYMLYGAAGCGARAFHILFKPRHKPDELGHQLPGWSPVAGRFR